MFEELRNRLSRIPGVRAVTYSQVGLFSGATLNSRLSIEGYTPGKRGDDVALLDRVGPGYFSTLGVPILLGRGIEPRDLQSVQPVCVVNERFAKFYFGTKNPIGKHVTVSDLPGLRDNVEIIGVSRDSRDRNFRGDVLRFFFRPALQPAQTLLGRYPPFLTYELRTDGEPSQVIRAGRTEILSFNREIQVGNGITLDSLLNGQLRQERIIAQLSTFFGAIALLLACIGIYGVLSYAAMQRTNEIGIRTAFGAGQGSILRMILGEIATLLFIGLIMGIPASLVCARFVQSKLFGIKPADPLTLTVALAIIVAAALAAGYLPAYRASRVNPVTALRYE